MVEIKRTSSQRRREMADHFTDKVAKKGNCCESKLCGTRTRLFGLVVGMFGIVGWSVAIPTLIGIALGLWIDRTWPSRYSWALMFLIIGVVLGCINAAYWVRKVRSKIINDDE